MAIAAETITSIYDASISDHRWANALDACKRAVDADASMLYQFSSNTLVQFSLNEVCTDVSRNRALLVEYNELLRNGQGSNYDKEGLGFVHRLPQNSVCLDEHIWDLNEAYLNRPEVQIGLRAGYLRRSFVNISDAPLTHSGMIFLYHGNRTDLIPSSVHRIAPEIAPHLAKATEISRFTHSLRAKYNAVLSVLDRISAPVFLVTNDANIIIKNQSANDVLERKRSLTEHRGQIQAIDEQSNDTLRAAISSANSTAQGNNDVAGSSVNLKKRNSDTSIVAIVSPIRDIGQEIDRQLAGALVILIDPDEPAVRNIDFISTIYELTNAELRVASLMLQGFPNLEVSERLNVSSETIKSQVSSILSKSGCQNRASFIWRVFQMTPPII